MHIDLTVKATLTLLFAQLVPAVTELIIAEIMYLQYKDRSKPMFLYINSTGTTRADGETVRHLVTKFVCFTKLYYCYRGCGDAI